MGLSHRWCIDRPNCCYSWHWRLVWSLVMAHSVIWSQQHRDTAIQMANEGYTASQIAAKIKRSRNSVIGFLHRHKIKLGIINKHHKPKNLPPPPRKPRPVKKVVFPEKPIDINPIPFLSSRMFQCKFIIKEDTDPWKTMCCGKPTQTGSWCNYHRTIVFKPRETRQNVRTNR